MQPEMSAPPVQEVGGLADDFTLPEIGGGSVNLSTLLEGKKGGVVVFWSGVCSHCVRYDGYLNGFGELHPELALIVVASRDGETPGQIRKTMGERGIRFRIVYDDGGGVARQWFTRQTPRAFLLDPYRTVLYRGAIDNFKYPGDPEYVTHLETAVSEFLAGKPVQRTETASFGCGIQSVYYTLPKHL